MSGSDSLVPTIGSCNTESFDTLHTCPADVFNVLRSLRPRKAPGADDIPPLLLKECARGISSSLSTLFNISFTQGKVPSEWKKALVIPVFKSGDRALPTNYRPISLLSIVSKVQERLVFNKLYRFLRPVLSSRQSGFCKEDGTEFQLVRLVQSWSDLLDNSQFVGAVFFDLKKAFDKVWHAGLLSKLSAAGVSGSAFLWFEDFLTRRTQRTVVGSSVSAELSPSAGVPQGAILSPLLFLVYVNDLPGALSAGEANLFADDTSVYVADRDLRCLQRRLQTAVDEVQVWMKKLLVTVNALKSAVMVFRTSHMAHASISLSINGELIKQVTVHRHLGLQLDECLTWSAHAARVICKLSQ